MTANVSKNGSSGNALMAPASGAVIESALAIMKYFGIRKIECRKIKSADYERIAASVKMFNGTPSEVASCGILVKDSLANILASTGVVCVEMTATEDEERQMAEGYRKMVDLHKSRVAASEGSSDMKKESGCKAETKNLETDERLPS